MISLVRVFVDILAEDSVDVNKKYPLENHQTILQVHNPSFSQLTLKLSVKAEATELFNLNLNFQYLNLHSVASGVV